MQIKFVTVIFLILGIFGTPFPGMSQKLTSDLFHPSTLVSSEIARKQIQKIYMTSGKQRTFHCSCGFDKLKQVFPNLCEDSSRAIFGKGDPQKLVWVSLVPPRVFANSLKCWEKSLCERPNGEKFKGGQCCLEISPKFKTRESDMHNIFPMVEEPPMVTPAGRSDFAGLWEYRYCGKGEGLAGVLRKEIRGDASRAYLYMSFQYKIPLGDSLENLLRKWHFEDPPDEWEEKRNDLIEIIQGNRNPFIDQPELVERVANF